MGNNLHSLEGILGVEYTFDESTIKYKIIGIPSEYARITFQLPNGGTMTKEVNIKEKFNELLQMANKAANVMEGIVKEMWYDGLLNMDATTFEDCQKQLLNDEGYLGISLAPDCSAEDYERVKLYVDLARLFLF